MTAKKLIAPVIMRLPTTLACRPSRTLDSYNTKTKYDPVTNPRKANAVGSMLEERKEYSTNPTSPSTRPTNESFIRGGALLHETRSLLSSIPSCELPM